MNAFGLPEVLHEFAKIKYPLNLLFVKLAKIKRR